jgi:hypothetical protein
VAQQAGAQPLFIHLRQVRGALQQGRGKAGFILPETVQIEAAAVENEGAEVSGRPQYRTPVQECPLFGGELRRLQRQAAMAIRNARHEDGGEVLYLRRRPQAAQQFREMPRQGKILRPGGAHGRPSIICSSSARSAALGRVA